MDIGVHRVAMQNSLNQRMHAEYSIKWHGTRSEKLAIKTDEDQYLKRSLVILVNVAEGSNAGDD